MERILLWKLIFRGPWNQLITPSFVIFKLPTSFLLSNPPLIAVLHFGLIQTNYQRISNVTNRNYIQIIFLCSKASMPQLKSNEHFQIIKFLYNFYILNYKKNYIILKNEKNVLSHTFGGDPFPLSV